MKVRKNTCAKSSKYRLLLITHGHADHASSRIRGLAYVTWLQNTGHWEVTWLPRIPKSQLGIFSTIKFTVSKYFKGLKRIWTIVFGNWDVILVQRMCFSRPLLSIIKWKHILLVYDFDDAIYLETGTSSINNLINTARMIRSSDEVIVSTEELISFCIEQGKRPHIVASPVDTHRIKPVRSYLLNNRPFTIGWIGSEWTTAYLSVAAKGIQQLVDNCSICLLLVGVAPEFQIEGVDTKVVAWSYDQEPALLQQMDVGIMPLPRNQWTVAKGGYKIFLYMAAGIPVVASPIGINSRIIDNGKNGFLAETDQEWRMHLGNLCGDADLRRRLGRRGRRTVEQEYCYKVTFPKIQEILEGLL